MQVTVLNVETELQKVFSGIHKLRFFPNLVINVPEDYDIFIEKFNNRKIVDLGDGMKTCSLTGKESKFKYSLIRNRIEYLVDDNSGSSTISYCARMNYMSFEVDHRTISVTPNREELQFVNSTLESLFAENEVKYAEHLHKHITKLAEDTVNLIKDSKNSELLSIANFTAFQKTKAQSNTLSDGTRVNDSFRIAFNSLLDSYYFDSDYSPSKMLNAITDWITKFNDRSTNRNIYGYHIYSDYSNPTFNLTEAIVSESQVKVQEGDWNGLNKTLNLLLNATRPYSSYTILLNDSIDSKNVELKRKLRDYVRRSSGKTVNFICISSRELAKVKIALRNDLRRLCGNSKVAVQIFDSLLKQLWKEMTDIIISEDNLITDLSSILGNSSVEPVQGQKIHYDIGAGRWEAELVENFARRRSGPTYYVDAKEVGADATTSLRPEFLQMKTLFQKHKNVFGIPDRQEITFIIFKSSKNQKDITTGEFGHKFKPISEFFDKHKIIFNILNTISSRYSNTYRNDVGLSLNFIKESFPYLDWNVFTWYNKQLSRYHTLTNEQRNMSMVESVFRFMKKLGFEFKEDSRIVNVENLIESFESAYQIDQKIKDLPDSITLRVLMDTLETLPIRITSYRYKRLKQADEKAVENLIKYLT